MDFAGIDIRELSDCIRGYTISPDCAQPISHSSVKNTYRVNPGIAIRSHKVTKTKWLSGVNRFTTTVLTPPDALVEVFTSDHIVSDKIFTESHVRRHSWFPRTLLPQTTHSAYQTPGVNYTVGQFTEPEWTSSYDSTGRARRERFGSPYGLHSCTHDSHWLADDIY